MVGRLDGDLKRAGIDYSVNVVDGCLKKAVVDITRGNPEIDYVVLNSYRGLETAAAMKLFRSRMCGMLSNVRWLWLALNR